MWTVTKRNYHGEEPPHDVRFIVHEHDKLRGICEAYTHETAVQIAVALNMSKSHVRVESC